MRLACSVQHRRWPEPVQAARRDGLEVHPADRVAGRSGVRRDRPAAACRDGRQAADPVQQVAVAGQHCSARHRAAEPEVLRVQVPPREAMRRAAMQREVQAARLAARADHRGGLRDVSRPDVHLRDDRLAGHRDHDHRVRALPDHGLPDRDAHLAAARAAQPVAREPEPVVQPAVRDVQRAEALKVQAAAEAPRVQADVMPEAAVGVAEPDALPGVAAVLAVSAVALRRVLPAWAARARLRVAPPALVPAGSMSGPRSRDHRSIRLRPAWWHGQRSAIRRSTETCLPSAAGE